ncbi:hypothetical protein BJ912DRAFT_964118 [Pholiota molesta]|nr:hypothetical protein BJ912DRAFT_964118 [Pholiota molesta]
MFGNQYRVEYFGSTRYGVSHSHSDLDLVVIDPAYPQGSTKKFFSEPIYKPRKLATAMMRCGFADVEFRAHSTVPIVKFKDRTTGLECDLNVNGRLGIVNSDMIKEYCDNSSVLRPLLFSIKEWAKPRQLNSPSGVGVPASFSSYAFALMTITFLQSEGLLPNLQADLPALSPQEADKTFVWSLKPRQGWDVRFRKLRDYTPPVEPDVDTLLLKWFQFWLNFPFDEKCASIRHGAFVDRGSPLLSEFTEKKPPSPVCVVDPFIRSKNVTAQVSKKVLERFKDECEKAATRMQPPPASES